MQDEKGQLNLARALSAPAPAAPQPAPPGPSPGTRPRIRHPQPLFGIKAKPHPGKRQDYLCRPRRRPPWASTSRAWTPPSPASSRSPWTSTPRSSAAPDTGAIKGKVQLTDLVNTQLKPDLDRGSVDADLSINNVPVAAIDRFAKQQGRLPAILGTVLNASVKAKGNRAQLDATVTVKSDNLGVDVSTQLRDSALSKLDAKIQLTNVPLAPVNQMLHQSGKLTSLLGAKLTTTITAKGDLANLDAAILARSEYLDTNLAAQLRDHKISLPAASAQQTQRIKLTVLPAAFAAFTTQPGQPASVKLVAPFNVTVALSDLQPNSPPTTSRTSPPSSPTSACPSARSSSTPAATSVPSPSTPSPPPSASTARVRRTAPS